jgi:hypothetical protein
MHFSSPSFVLHTLPTWVRNWPNILTFPLPSALPSLKGSCTRSSGHCTGTLKVGKPLASP